jgi:hypothetical protein
MVATSSITGATAMSHSLHLAIAQDREAELKRIAATAHIHGGRPAHGCKLLRSDTSAIRHVHRVLRAARSIRSFP